MFHLASSLYTQYTKREQYNVLVLGLDNAGKTTFLEHVKLHYPSPSDKTPDKKLAKSPQDLQLALRSKRIVPTVGQNTTTISFKPLRKSVNLKFWDLGGQRSLRGMWSRYYQQCHGIIFVIDLTDSARFQECCDTLMSIARDAAWAADPESEKADYDEEAAIYEEGNIGVNVPVLMLANKQDLPQATDLVLLKTGVFIQMVSELEVTDAKLLPVLVLENSGVQESLEWLVVRMEHNKANKKPNYS